MAQPARGSGIPLGRIFGIPIYLHPSWFIIFLLITLSLRTQFVSQHPGWTPAQHWTLGIVTSVLFFGSVVFHELCHSMVARSYRIPVDSISLFVFGGLAKIQREAENAMQEINIAIAGPLSSLFLAGCFWLIAYFSPADSMIAAASKWLWEINLTLALFNLLPGFPLDGGRVLRGIAWGITKDFTRATSIASNSGKIFAYGLIFVGIWQALNGNWVSGLWTAFIGWFLLSASQETYAQVALRNTLTGVRAQDIMTSDVPTVARDISLEEYVHEVLRTGRRCHVVTAGGKPVGLVTLHGVRTVPRDEWGNTSIQAAMLPLDRIHSASPDEPALAVLDRMQNEDINQMPVVSEGHIVGMIARDTILRFLQTRLQLGRFAEQ
jgi:Zn-dependent protease/predicted transcriptional regulator